MIDWFRDISLRKYSQYERRTNLQRFEGSSSISSADYFGDGSSRSRSNANAAPSYNIQVKDLHFFLWKRIDYLFIFTVNHQTPDLDEVKESVRQGVTKVASKLSSLANDFASSIQVIYQVSIHTRLCVLYMDGLLNRIFYCRIAMATSSSATYCCMMRMDACVLCVCASYFFFKSLLSLQKRKLLYGGQQFHINFRLVIFFTP